MHIMRLVHFALAKSIDSSNALEYAQPFSVAELPEPGCGTGVSSVSCGRETSEALAQGSGWELTTVVL